MRILEAERMMWKSSYWMESIENTEREGDCWFKKKKNNNEEEEKGLILTGMEAVYGIAPNLIWACKPR